MPSTDPTPIPAAALEQIAERVKVRVPSLPGVRWLLDSRPFAVIAEVAWAAGRTAAAEDIRRETATFCMDGVGRHLVDACARIAENGADR